MQQRKRSLLRFLSRKLVNVEYRGIIRCKHTSIDNCHKGRNKIDLSLHDLNCVINEQLMRMMMDDLVLLKTKLVMERLTGVKKTQEVVSQRCLRLNYRRVHQTRKNDVVET
jgi:hypothetical protein